MSYKFMKIATAAIILLSGTMLFAAGLTDNSGLADNAGEINGQIIYIEGEATLNGAAAELGNTVKPGDQITTGTASTVEIAFGEQNILQFQENSDVVIQADWAGIELKQGIVAGVLNKLKSIGISKENPFTVNTELTVMAVRGTSFFIHNGVPGNVYHCTCNGEIQYESSDGNIVETVEANHHNPVMFFKDESGILQREDASGYNYHDDDSMNAVAAKVNTSIPWKD
ncbi:MAG: hypothetical protein B0D92_00685 [Spirochaeta sp. LUC14_002_19_P3]|nr:MAG: hypothetical protein B0D92_00685 [Spirochaeta sp. LUC14_002_19_P3]